MIPGTVAARIPRAGAAGIGLLLMASWVQAGESANAAAAGSYKPTIDNWFGVNAFEFQSATRATHYGYYISVYPDLKTKITTVGLPGHYEDVLEKRGGEWRILQRTTAIGAK